MPPSAIDTAWSHLRQGHPDLARTSLQRHLRLRPRDPDALLAMAHVHIELDELPQAIAIADRALAALPDHPSPLLARATALLLTDEHDTEASADFRRAIALSPDDPRPWQAWSDASIRGLRPDRAVAILREALANLPEQPGILQRLCYALNVAGGSTAGEERDLHERLARATSEAIAPARPDAFSNSREVDRPLRVAFLSSDLREHSCAYFLRSPLEHLKGSDISIVLYSTTRDPDAVTDGFRRMAEFHDVSTLDSAALAARCRMDAIDILIDANAWTVASQMRAMALRLAPVQMTYLGYPHTSGLSTIDFRIVDAITDPPGTDDAMTERPLRLPECFVCFRPGDAWEVPRTTPFQRDEGPVTFGSFNNIAKLGPRVIEAWADILEATPHSRLLLKGLSLGLGAARLLRRRFSARGIAPERIVIAPATPDTASHVATYSQVDIALDPFPYNGTTTTCEALWMGAPVISWQGGSHRARVGASLLNAVGLSELICGDLAAYVQAATLLAADRERLKTYRETLRPRMAASPLCDGAAFARAFTDAMRGAWREWASANPARR